MSPDPRPLGLMPSLSLRVWLLATHLAVLALPLLVLIGTGGLFRDLLEQTEADLDHQAALLALLVARELEHARHVEPAARLDALGGVLTPDLIRAKDATLASIRVVNASGRVIASSGEQVGEDLSDRLEVADALEGAVGTELRPRPAYRSAPLASPSRRATVRLYLAKPVLDAGGRTVGAVVLARTPREEVQALYQMVPWWAAVLPVGLTLALALWAGHITSRSLHRLEAVSRRVADGHFPSGRGLQRTSESRISEVRGLSAAFQHMSDRLQERLAYISELAAHVAHEFRTPIATLRGTIELMQDDADMPASQRARFLDNALAELHRLDRLVGGLLVLARAEQAGDQVHVDLDALLADVAAPFTIPVTGRAGAVRGQPEQLRQALTNLLDNARRHGGPHVTVAVRRDRDHVTIAVTDDGPGITAANLPRVFDRFFTTRRDTGGTGLGLALVRAVALAHGGDVTATSAPGATTFTLRLRAT